MSLHLMRVGKTPTPLKEIVELSLMGALMVGTQVAMSALPNINIISVLIILTVVVYGIKTFYSIGIFVLIEGLIYGFGLWFLNYLYVWAVLIVIALIFRKVRNQLIWGVIAGMFGLCFGMLCAIPYFFIGGPAMALSYWVSGIPFDIIQCISNFTLTLVLFKPLLKLLLKLR